MYNSSKVSEPFLSHGVSFLKKFQSFTKWGQVLRYLEKGNNRLLPGESGFHGASLLFCPGGASECLTSGSNERMLLL